MKLNNLIYFIGTYYYQSVWDCYNNHSEIFSDLQNEPLQIRVGLRNDVISLLNQSPNIIFDTLNKFGKDAGGLSFDTPEDAILFLKKT